MFNTNGKMSDNYQPSGLFVSPLLLHCCQCDVLWSEFIIIIIIIITDLWTKELDVVPVCWEVEYFFLIC